jgi:hypothetical protein
MRDPKERIDELLAANVRFEERARDAEGLVGRLRAALKEALTENVWNAYHAGIVRDGLWRTGGMSDAEWLSRELGLSEHATYMTSLIESRLDGLVERLLARVEADAKT